MRAHDRAFERGDDSIVMFESWLATGDDAILEDIERYNDDDCRSTHLLLGWLLERRDERAVQIGAAFPWRAPKDVEPTEDANRSELAAAMLSGIEPPTSLSALRALPDAARARWLLGNLLDYHAREARPAYWKLYDRYDHHDRLLDGDHESIAELRIDASIAPFKASPATAIWCTPTIFPSSTTASRKTTSRTPRTISAWLERSSHSMRTHGYCK